MKRILFVTFVSFCSFSRCRRSPRTPARTSSSSWPTISAGPTSAAYGSKYYETPNIDRLAAQGMRLTRLSHCQNCQPTRAALMSGQYGPRTGVYTVGGIDRFDWQTRPLRPVDNVQQLPLDKVDHRPGS